MSETETLFAALRQSANTDVVDMLERMVRDAPDHALNRMNALDLAAKAEVGEERVIASIYRTDTLAIGERLKILSLTFLFSDLRGSTELYERVGDLIAFDLVNEHSGCCRRSSRPRGAPS